MFELDPGRRDELVESWARRIVDRGLATPAVFLLEAHKPLSGLGAHAVVAFQPLISPLVRINAGELAAFMRDTQNVEMLLRKIETLERDREDTEQARRRRATAVRRR